MKGLRGYSNVQKAKLLFDLFPEDIPAFITYATDMVERIKKERDQLQTAGAAGNIFPSNYWVKLAEDVAQRLKQNADTLVKSSTVLSEQLFEGDRAFLVKHCLTQYCQTEKMKKSNFSDGVTLLFQ